MIVDQERLLRRRKYIKEMIDNRNESLSKEIRQLARELFISERTVYRDLRQARLEDQVEWEFL